MNYCGYLKSSDILYSALKSEKVRQVACGRNHTIIATGKKHP